MALSARLWPLLSRRIKVCNEMLSDLDRIKSASKATRKTRAKLPKSADGWIISKNPKILFLNTFIEMDGGGGGIRTHGRLSPTSVFKTGAFNHSATPPTGE